MDKITYDNVAQNLIALARDIELQKRPAYTGDNPDVLHNFKTVASRLGITPMQAWGVYFLKHIDSIMSATSNIKQAEPLGGRFADATNYLKLGLALFIDEQSSESLELFRKDPDDFKRYLDHTKEMANRIKADEG